MSQWKKVKIRDFLTERKGRYKPDDKLISKYQRLDKIDFSGTMHISNKPTKTDMILVYSGDLVISGINVAKGAITVYQGKEPVCATIHYSAYTFDDSKVDLDYFKFFVKSPAFLEILKQQIKGGIKTEIKPKHLLPLEISIPDLSEQKRIVSVLSKNLKKTEELQKEIDSQKENVKLLRQNILQDAIEGKLTAGWRKSHPVIKGNPDYDAEALFEKIQKEKATDKKQKKLQPITDEEKPFEIPEGWKWVRFGAVVDIITNIVNSSDYKNMIQISPDDIKKNTGELIYPLRTVKEKEIISVNHLFSNNMLIYSKIRPRLRKIVYVDFDGLCSADMYPLRTSLNYIFLKLLMLSDYFDLEVYKFDNRVKMPKINQAQLNSIKFPLPPLKEQEEIVAKVEILLAKVTELENQIQERKILSEKLAFGIIKEKLEGK